MRQTSPKGEMWHAAHAMAQSEDETVEDGVASALEPFASTHSARALFLRGEAEKVGEVVRDQRKENYGELLLWCSRYVLLSHWSKRVTIR